MSIATDITRIVQAKGAIVTAIKGKGTAVPDGAKIDQLPALISAIASGTNTSDATVTAAQILAGYTAYAQGSKLTGTMPSYTGATTVYPSSSTQTIQTAGRYIASNISVGGVSRFNYNYGSSSINSSAYTEFYAGFTPFAITGYFSYGGSSYVFAWNTYHGVRQSTNDGAYHSYGSVSAGTTTGIYFRNKSNSTWPGSCTFYWYAAGWY